MPRQARRQEEALPLNPMKRYSSYRVFYTIKLSREFHEVNGEFILTDTTSGPPEDSILLLDTRGEGRGRTASSGNLFPKFSVRSFDTLYESPGGPLTVTPNIESTLILYERGGASYLQELGETMLSLKSNTPNEMIMWVGVGIYGWVPEDPAAANLHPKQITQKWWPLKIKKIDMEMTDSGSTYTHWLIGMQYLMTQEPLYTKINAIHTFGKTLGDHLNVLVENINEDIEKAANRGNQNVDTRETPPGSGRIKPLRFSEITFEPSYGVTINKNALMKTNAAFKGRALETIISSGGGKGHTTIDAHIRELIKHCPEVSKYLSDQIARYVILPRIETTAEEQRVAIVIKPVIMDPEKRDLLPLRRYHYFFGGKNEDVLKFDLQFEGLNHVLPNSHYDISTSRANPNPEQASEGVENYKRTSEAENRAEESVGGAGARNPSDSTSVTDNNFVAANRRGKLGNSFTPFLPTREEFGTTQTDEAAENYKEWLTRAIAHVGDQILQGGFTIVGDPYLIWDPATIRDLRQTGIDIEGLDNYITFTVGTPNPEFPDVPDIDRFIFSGGYQIKRIKTEFNSEGQFTQNIVVIFKPDTSFFGGNTTPISRSDVNSLSQVT